MMTENNDKGNKKGRGKWMARLPYSNQETDKPRPRRAGFVTGQASVQNSGQAFTADEFNLYGYNDRNELTESARYIGADISDTTNPVEPEYRSYNYDPIGNRNDATEWDKAGAVQSNLTYTSNQLNQYELIINDIGQPADSLTYDTDGNLTSISDGTTTTQYTYNAENRLISVEPETPSDNDTKVEFTYDYMGRRVQKIVSTYSSGSWIPASEFLFLYDGWNLVEELATRNSQLETRYFVWGLDLSQSLQGAGGIGGLITAIDGVDSYQYAYDGNGNVGQLINAADGSIDAHYEYDPYGNELVATGPEAQNNIYRFSTKYFDDEIDLYYYGYRYYSAELGRWLSRDPLGEQGGLNFYAFVGNNPANRMDSNGLKTTFNMSSIAAAQLIVAGRGGLATARTDCINGKYYEAKYVVFGTGLAAGVGIEFDKLGKIVKELIGSGASAEAHKTFTTEDNYPPVYASFLDVETKSVSLIYTLTFIDMEFSTYEGGREDIDLFTRGWTGRIGFQLFKFEGVHLIRLGKPKEKCCDE